MIDLDELARRFAGLERAELVRWIDNRWIVPDQQGGAWLFREVDIARVELILHVRQEYAVEDDAMALVLGLLDQVYGLRRQMRRLCGAIEGQPPEIRDAIRRALPPARADNVHGG
ncbi:MAG TPA: chaperone modulator CbpM [Stellaceae bacterium]|jgi:chaperone modulatory protein CbpM|nr:chaperone modulator CbpM [Stellaceae bacterium]